MTQYIITGEPFGTRAQLSPYSLVATANLGVGQTINLTLSAQDEATLIAAGILQLYPGAGAYRGAWQPNWRYDANDVVLFAGSLYEANAAFTSGASFNVTNWTQISGSGGSGSSLTLTAVQSSGTYAASVGDEVLVDLSTSNVAITLPNAPADKSQVGWKIVKYAAGHTLTINRSGSDVFNVAAGPASQTGQMLDQAKVYQYQHSTGIWIAIEGDNSLAQLDSRYGLARSVSVVDPTLSSGPADNTNTNFCDAAFAAAFAKAATFNQFGQGGNVVVTGPPGEYKFSKPFNVPPGIVLNKFGDGALDCATFNFPTETGYGFAVGLTTAAVSIGASTFSLQNVKGVFNPAGGVAVLQFMPISYTAATVSGGITTLTGVTGVTSTLGAGGQGCCSGYLVGAAKTTSAVLDETIIVQGPGSSLGTIRAVPPAASATALSGGPLSTGAPITSLGPLTATTTALPQGTTVTINDGAGHTQTWTLSADTAVGVTAYPVNSQTPNFAYTTGATVTSVGCVDGIYVAGKINCRVGNVRHGYVYYGDHEIFGQHTSLAGGHLWSMFCAEAPLNVNWISVDSGNQRWENHGVWQGVAWSQHYITANNSLIAAQIGIGHWGTAQWFMFGESTAGISNPVGVVNDLDVRDPSIESNGLGIIGCADNNRALRDVDIYNPSYTAGSAVGGYTSALFVANLIQNLNLHDIGAGFPPVLGSSWFAITDGLTGGMDGNSAEQGAGLNNPFVNFGLGVISSPSNLTPPAINFRFPGGCLVSGSANNTAAGDVVQAFGTVNSALFNAVKYRQYNSTNAPVGGVALAAETNYVIPIAIDRQAGSVKVNVASGGDITANTTIRANGSTAGKAKSISGSGDGTAPSFGWATTNDSAGQATILLTGGSPQGNPNAADKSSASAQVFTGNLQAPALIAAGLTGVSGGGRFVGAMATAPPTSGTFLQGDFCTIDTGAVGVCTVGGTPGTWVVIGSTGTVPSLGPVVLPLTALMAFGQNSAAVIATIYGLRYIVPASGTLHDISLPMNAFSGNCHVGVYDTGQASSTNRTKLYDSGSIAMSGSANSWAVIADPALAVTAGQQIDVVAEFDNITANFFSPAHVPTVNDPAQLPFASGSFGNTAVLTKIAWKSTQLTGTYAALPATVTEAQAVATGSAQVPLFGCRIA